MSRSSGVFVTHVLHLFRRLNRICSYYGSDPTHNTSSATMGNPKISPSTVRSTPSRKREPRQRRATLSFSTHRKAPIPWRPTRCAWSVQKDYCTIVFTRPRDRWCIAKPRKAAPICARKSRLPSEHLPEERRWTEHDLNSGDLLGVVSTALEFGIDIGGLDVCVLVGYPGSIINTWQRAGRRSCRTRIAHHFIAPKMPSTSIS